MKIIDLYKGIFNDLCHYVYTIVKDQSASEDIVQETFIKLLNKKNINDIKLLKPYLYKSAYHGAIDYVNQLKKREVLSDHFEDNQLYDQEIRTQESAVIIEESVKKVLEYLPDVCRQVFLLAKRDGLKYMEIAEKLNISVKTVEAHMGNAFKKIKKYLAENHHYLSLWTVLIIYCCHEN